MSSRRSLFEAASEVGQLKISTVTEVSFNDSVNLPHLLKLPGWKAAL